ncbi:hypothetical protein [Pelagicoccus sp. SDUM812003]|uniref:hypothetical protein n=1 Tax=Pelagicoccus sp. SDUM812003 TaxID=3041267 RepID=UPI00280CC75B|nr:hypothetical protein [Pelagicoccus sp. SDUM812003]MDQ8204391.1 hypothetical protein [Pelagicoccus sp. SDUM812003]
MKRGTRGSASKTLQTNVLLQKIPEPERHEALAQLIFATLQKRVEHGETASRQGAAVIQPWRSAAGRATVNEKSQPRDAAGFAKINRGFD